MEEIAMRTHTGYSSPPLPPKVRSETGSSLTSIEPIEDTLESSMHSIVLNPSRPATVFVAGSSADVAASAAHAHDQHAVTIRVNTDPNAIDTKAPVISSVHLKTGASFRTSFGASSEKKNNSVVRINVDEPVRTPDDSWEDHRRTSGQSEMDSPYIFCNSMTTTVMSSGQCSPSDTLDSGTCSDLDSTPPPLPKKKSSKSNCTTKGASVTLITFENASRKDSNRSADLDFEDDDSNISCDSLNSSELNGSVKSEESDNKREKQPPTAPEMPEFVTHNNSDMRCGLLRDIRTRSATLKESSEEKCWSESSGSDQESALTSFAMVAQISKENLKNQDLTSLPAEKASKPPLISESTYEERQKEKKCYSGSFIYDADKFYDFHLNEKVFEPIASAVRCDSDEPEYFAGVKDYDSEEPPSTIRSSKGTIRGVKNRVRAGIATFLQIQTTTKSYKEKDAGKVVLYTTTMGIVRPTYQRCVLVKKILRNLLVKYEERDVFMSSEYQDEIRDRMHSDDILVPQLFIDGQHIGDADTVEKLNESGELRKMLKPYKSPDACNTCQTCGGFRLLPCRVCNGSKKSLHRNHFTAEFVALKCMNCDEVGLVRCEACC